MSAEDEAPGWLPGIEKKNPLLTRKALAQALGVHPQTIVKWEADGCPVAQHGGRGRASKYSLADVVAWRVNSVRQEPGEESLSLERERAGLARAQRIRTETENARVARALIPVDEVIRQGQQFVRAWRAMLLGLPRHLRRSGLITPDQEPAVKDAFRRLLDEVSRWRVPADLDASVKATEEAGDVPGREDAAL